MLPLWRNILLQLQIYALLKLLGTVGSGQNIFPYVITFVYLKTKFWNIDYFFFFTLSCCCCSLWDYKKISCMSKAMFLQTLWHMHKCEKSHNVFFFFCIPVVALCALWPNKLYIKVKQNMYLNKWDWQHSIHSKGEQNTVFFLQDICLII